MCEPSVQIIKFKISINNVILISKGNLGIQVSVGKGSTMKEIYPNIYRFGLLLLSDQ